jgi:hypothetical protein
MAIDPVTAGLFEAVAATPDKASASIDLGSDIQRNGDAELVVSLFRRALVLDPSSLEAAASLAFACAAAFRPHDGRTILMGRRLIDF